MATKCLQGGDRRVRVLDQGMMHVLGGTERDRARLQHATQNDAQFKTYELFISEIFHLIFSNHGWPQLTETKDHETTDKGGLLYIKTLYNDME